MASRTRPIVMTGVALASAATVVAAVPVIVPTNDVVVASSSPAPLALSTATYELTALTDIIPGLTSGLGTTTPTTPGGFLLSGLGGVVQNSLSCAFTGNCASSNGNLGLTLGNAAAPTGSSALLDTVVTLLFGKNSPVGNLISVIFNNGVTSAVSAALIVSAAKLVVPTLNVGPVKVGGGILASVFLTGRTPDGSLFKPPSFNNGSGGLQALFNYVAAAFSKAAPGAAATAVGGTTTQVAALSVAAPEAPASGTIKPEEKTTEAQTTIEAAPATASGVQKQADATSCDSGAAAVTPARATETGASAEGAVEVPKTKTKTGTSTEDAAVVPKITTEAGTSPDNVTEVARATTKPSTEDATAGTATDRAPKSTAVAKSAKPDSPLSKVGKRISDAMSGKKADKSESGSSSDSAGSGGSGSAGGSATS